MSLLTSAPISQLAVELLQRQLVLVATVNRVPAGEYRGPSGGTVTVRVPEARDARQQSTPGATITYDAVSERGISVVLDHFYAASLVSDEDLSLTIEDFGFQILGPMIEAIARKSEDSLAQVMNGLTADTDITWNMTPNADADLATFLEIRRLLTINGVPMANRYVAASPTIVNRLLEIPTFVQASKRGSTTALDSAIVGDVFGMTVVESNAVDDGAAIGYHASAFAYASAAPADPGAGADSTNATAGNVTLRITQAFSPDHLATAVAASIFAGCSLITEPANAVLRAVKVDTAEAS